MKEANSNLIIEQTDTSFVGDLKIIVGSAREYSYRAANLMQVISNWLVGWRIVEQEQHGSKRAEYGKHVIELASKALTEEFGKGYSETNIRSFRRFYLEFKDIQIQQTVSAEFKEKIIQIQQTISAESDGGINPLPIPLNGATEKNNIQILSSQLSWSHYERLMRVSDLQAREWYMKEAVSQQWNYQTLRRNIDTQYYYRLLQTPDALPSHADPGCTKATGD